MVDRIRFKLLPKLLIVNAEQGNVAFITNGNDISGVLGVTVPSLDFDTGVMLDAVRIGEDLATADDKCG